jgi:GAF domain-containing protein
VIDVEVTSIPRIHSGKPAVQVIIRDISERKKARVLLERQLKELTILHEISIAASSSTNSDEIIRSVTRIIGNMLYPENCGILVMNSARDALTPHPSYRGTAETNLVANLAITKGISGRVAVTRKAQRVDDVTYDPDYYAVTSNVHSELCVPILNGLHIFGVINVESVNLSAFSEEDERLLVTIAGGLASTIERFRLFETQQSHLQREAAILDLMRIAASSLDLEEVLEIILDHLLKLIPSESGTIQLLEGDCLRVVTSIGFQFGEMIPNTLLSLKDFPLNAEVVNSQKIISIDDVDSDKRFKHVPGTERVGSILAIPLFIKNKVIGIVTLDSAKKYHFNPEDEELGLAVAHNAAIALENARLFESEQLRRSEAERLRDASSALTTSVDPDALYKVILDSISILVPADCVRVDLVGENGIETVASRGDFNYQQNPDQYNLTSHEMWDWIKNSHHPKIIGDIKLDDRFNSQRLKNLRAWMGVPLIVQENLIGVLNLYHHQLGIYTEDHAAIAGTFAGQAAIAIENALLFQEERRRTRIIEAMAEIANEVATSGEVSLLLDKVAQKTMDLLQASHVAIYLLQDDNETVKVVTAQGSYSEQLLTHSIKIGEGITGNIIAKGRSEIINDTSKDPRRIKVPGTSEEDGLLETMMSSALLLDGKSIGAINVWRLRSKGFFVESELNFLISIAHQAAVSIKLSQLLEETRKQAREATAIAEVGREISATLQLDKVLDRIATFAKELLNAETSAVHLYEPEHNRLRAIAAIGVDAKEIKNDPTGLGEGIVGSIAVSMKGEIVNYASKDHRARTVKGTPDSPEEHIMAVPVQTSDQLTGLLVVWRTGIGQEFIPSELEFLTSLAHQAGIAIENARLYQLELKRRQEAETLQIAANAVTSSLEPKEVLEKILVALQQVVPYDSASIFLIDNNQVRIVAAKGFPNNELLIGKTFPASNALLQAVHQEGQPVILQDAQVDPRFEKWVDAISVHGWMGVPLIARGEITGYFTIDSTKIGAFDRRASILAQTFAHQASAALENARLYNETLQRLEEQEIVSRISVALRSARDSEEMLPILLDEVMASMESNTCAIWLMDEDRNELIQRISSGWLANLPKNNFRPNEGIIGRVYRTGKPHLSQELAKEPLVHPDNLDFYTEGWGGITMPIQTRSNVIGVLGVALPTPRLVEPRHIRLLTTITEIAGNAIHRVNLFKRSEYQVQHLTALRDVDTAIASSFDLNVTLTILSNHILTHMNADAVSIFRIDNDSMGLSFIAGEGFSTRASHDMKIKIGSGLGGRALITRKDVYVKNLSEEKSFNRRSLLTQDRFISYYAVPLISKGQPQGLLELFFRRSFTPALEWIEFIQSLAGQATIAMDNSRLFEDLQRSNQELSLAYDTTLEGWSKALELRDKETQGHTRRVADLTMELARKMRVDENSLINIHRGVLLHDIGKMGVSDFILHKNGPLTEEEKTIMENHPTYAYELLSTIPYLKSALDIPFCHHEWWDGTGYPRKLKGEQIPLPARIFTVVDVWDALLSDRPYRKAWPKSKAVRYLSEHSGTQFDPNVLECFLEIVKSNKRKN